jgi:hypothetical protein
MTSLIGFVVVATATALIAARAGARPPVGAPDVPWSLPDAAGRQIVILGGMSGFAVTAIVLLVTIVRDATGVDRAQYNAVIVLFLVAWVSMVGTAVMWTRVPRNDYGEPLLQRLHYGITNDQHFRSIVLGWLAMIPLLLAFDLQRPAAVFAAVVALAGLDGAVLSLVALHRLGFMRLRDVAAIPIVSLAGAAGWATLAGLVPALRATESALYLAVAMVLLNGAMLGIAATGPVLISAERFRGFITARGHVLFIADGAASVTLLAFLWLAAVGWV